MKVGVLELLIPEARSSWRDRAYNLLITRQHASIMPQTISVWCRQLGHEVYYATYFGQQDPGTLLPPGLDLVFISAFTRASALAYALAKLHRREGTRTVIGGPHAKAFPEDCLRFFDVAVQECDRTLIAEILKDLPCGETVSSGRALSEVPTVEERMPEIQRSIFWRGRPYISTCVHLLTSVGCPYACDFCTVWNTPYTLLPPAQLAEDLKFISSHFPGVMVGFADPNFAVRFDQVLSTLETVPSRARNRYLIESSLSVLKGSRLQRLRDTGCFFVAPGVESWAGYSNKSGLGSSARGASKLDGVVDHFQLIHEYIPGIQANFIFGLDVDHGDEPVELTREFMARCPFVWPTFNIPIPFGGTPLYDRYLQEGRILKAMPFAFYSLPYTVTTVSNYSPIAYYDKLVHLYEYNASRRMLIERLLATRSVVRLAYLLRTSGELRSLAAFRRILKLLREDRKFRAFHEGEAQDLPAFYQEEYDRLLGPYASLLSPEERTPLLPRASSEEPLRLTVH